MRAARARASTSLSMSAISVCMRIWVYVLECADGRLYVGSHRGEDVAARVWDHNEGVSKTAYTYHRRPVTLVWAGEFEDPAEAVAFERQMKGWTRAKKVAFIAEDWDTLKKLSRSRTAPPIHEKGKFYRLTHPEAGDKKGSS